MSTGTSLHQFASIEVEAICLVGSLAVSAPAQIAATCNVQLSISCGILSTLQSFHDVGTKKVEPYLGGQFKRFHYILAQNQSMRKTPKKKLFTPSATPEILDEVRKWESS